uniref:Uncharacterized protein n=1 Tax=viral metagenome TaxID=1070528 RepID=A0A6C0HM02_9ZZZZ
MTITLMDLVSKIANINLNSRENFNNNGPIGNIILIIFILLCIIMVILVCYLIVYFSNFKI